MRRRFESFLVLQGRSTGTACTAGGQSLRLRALSSAQSSAAGSFFRSLGHSVARSLFRSLSRPPRSPLRSTARPLVRPLAWSRERSSPRSLPSSFDRSLVCLLANAGSLACWFGSLRARSSHILLVFSWSPYNGKSSERNSGTEPRQVTFLLG